MPAYCCRQKSLDVTTHALRLVFQWVSMHSGRYPGTTRWKEEDTKTEAGIALAQFFPIQWLEHFTVRAHEQPEANLLNHCRYRHSLFHWVTGTLHCTYVYSHVYEPYVGCLPGPRPMFPPFVEDVWQKLNISFQHHIRQSCFLCSMYWMARFRFGRTVSCLTKSSY